MPARRRERPEPPASLPEPETPSLIPQLEAEGRFFTPQELSTHISQRTDELMASIGDGAITREEYERQYKEIRGLADTLGEETSQRLETYGIIPDLPKGTTIFDDDFFALIRNAPPEQQMRFLFWQDPEDPETNPWRIHRQVLDGGYGLNTDTRGGGHKSWFDEFKDMAGDSWGTLVKILEWPSEQVEDHLLDVALKDVLPDAEGRRIVAENGFRLAFSSFTDKGVARDIVNAYILDTNLHRLQKVTPGQAPWQNLEEASAQSNWTGILGDFLARVTFDPLWAIAPLKAGAGTVLFGKELMRGGFALKTAGGLVKGKEVAKGVTVLPRLGRILAGGPSSGAARQVEKMVSADLFLAARGEVNHTPGILGFLNRRTPQGLGIETMRVTTTSIMEPWMNDTTKGIGDLVSVFDDIGKAASRDDAVRVLRAKGWNDLAANPETSRFAQYLKKSKTTLLEEGYEDSVKVLREAGMEESFIRRMTVGHFLERHAPKLQQTLEGATPKWYRKVIRPFAAAQKRAMSVLALSAPRFITLNIGYNGFIGLITTGAKFPSRALRSFRPFQKLGATDELAENITRVGGDAALHDQFVANTTFLRDVLGKSPAEGIDLGDAQKLVDDVFGKTAEGTKWTDRLNHAVAFPVYLATNFVDMPTRRLVYGKALGDALHFSDDFLSRGGLIDDLPRELREAMPDWAVDLLLEEMRKSPMTADGVRGALVALESRLTATDTMSKITANMLKDRFVRENMGLADNFATKVASRDFDESANRVVRALDESPGRTVDDFTNEIGIIRDEYYSQANVIHEMNNMAPVVSKGPGFEKARVFQMETMKQMAMDEIGHIERLLEMTLGGTLARAERGTILRAMSRYFSDDVGRADDIWKRVKAFDLDPKDVKRIVKGAKKAAAKAGRSDEEGAFVYTALHRARRSGRQRILKELDGHYAQSAKNLDELDDLVSRVLEGNDWVAAGVSRAFFAERRAARARHLELIGEAHKEAALAGSRNAEALVWEKFGKETGRLYEQMADEQGRLLMGYGPNQPSYKVGHSPVDRTTEVMAFRAHQQDRFLEWAEETVRKDWDTLTGQTVDAVPQLWKDGLDEWGKGVAAAREGHAVGVKIAAYERAAFSLTSYERQYGWDAIMQVFAPFEFFPSRILWNWGRRMYDNPAAVGLLWKFGRLSNNASDKVWRAQATEALQAYGLSEKDTKKAVKGMAGPNKFRNMVPIPMPFLSQIPGIGNIVKAAGVESLGQIGWIDPLAYTNPMEFYAREFYEDERKKSTPLGLATDWVAQNTPFGPSPLWTQMGSMTGLLPERQAWTNTLISGMPLGLPATRAARGIWSFLGSGNDLGEMSNEEKEFLVNNEYLPESLLRRAIGLPPGDEWEGYLIDRTMASLLFTGDLDGELFTKQEQGQWGTLKEKGRGRTPEEEQRYLDLREVRSARATQALKDRAGPAYVKARLQGSRERGLRDVTGWAGIRISPFLEGDLVARGLKVLHDEAASTGNLSGFYDRYPEYQLRNVALSNFDKGDDEGRAVEIDNTLYWFDRTRLESLYEETITELNDARRYIEAQEQTPEVALALRDVKSQQSATYDEMNEATEQLDEVYPLRKKEFSLFTDPKVKALQDLREQYFAIQPDPAIADDAERWDKFEAAQDAFLSTLPPRSPNDDPRDWWDLKITILRENTKSSNSLSRAFDEGRFSDADRIKAQRDNTFQAIHDLAASRVTRYDFELFLNGGWKPPTERQAEFQKAQEMFDWLMTLISEDSPLSGRQKAGIVDAYTADPTFQKYFGDRFIDPFVTEDWMTTDPEIQRYFAGAPRNQIPAAAIARRREIFDHYGNLDRGRPRTDYLRATLPELNTIQRILGLESIQLFEPSPPKPRLPWLPPTEDDIDQMALSIVRRGY